MNRITSEMHPILNDAIIKALHLKRIFTVSNFLKTDSHLIAKTTRLSFKEVLDVKKVLLKTYSAKPTNGFDDYKNSLSNGAIISTGLNSVDKLLEGGLFTGNIYEICGLAASGKTKFVQTVVKNAILENQQVYYLDTKHDFVGKTFYNMLNHQQADENCLKRVLVKRIATRYDLLNSLHEIKNDFVKSELKHLRLIVIDSLPVLVLQSTDIFKNNVFLSHLAEVMRFIAVEYHVAFLVTNLITTWSDGSFDNKQAAVERVCCGKYWNNISNTRLKIERKIATNQCPVATRMNNYAVTKLFPVTSSSVNISVDVVITDEGVVDA